MGNSFVQHLISPLPCNTSDKSKTIENVTWLCMSRPAATGGVVLKFCCAQKKIFKHIIKTGILLPLKCISPQTLKPDYEPAVYVTFTTTSWLWVDLPSREIDSLKKEACWMSKHWIVDKDSKNLVSMQEIERARRMWTLRNSQWPSPSSTTARIRE